MARTPGSSNEQRRIEIADPLLRLRRVGVTDQKILAAIEAVPRDIFVPVESVGEAYAERALPIDCGQTISAPAIVGIMTAALEVGDRDRGPEIGPGVGNRRRGLPRLAGGSTPSALFPPR